MKQLVITSIAKEWLFKSMSPVKVEDFLGYIIPLNRTVYCFVDSHGVAQLTSEKLKRLSWRKRRKYIKYLHKIGFLYTSEYIPYPFPELEEEIPMNMNLLVDLSGVEDVSCR